VGGPAPIASGANSVASALHQPPGRDPCGQIHPNMPFPTYLSKQDTSTWHTLGLFYSALTIVKEIFTPPREPPRLGHLRPCRSVD
jgi:hypothetical protein